LVIYNLSEHILLLMWILLLQELIIEYKLN
jgi:hypothetical protein